MPAVELSFHAKKLPPFDVLRSRQTMYRMICNRMNDFGAGDVGRYSLGARPAFRASIRVQFGPAAQTTRLFADLNVGQSKL
jgi:hypothetical protein